MKKLRRRYVAFRVGGELGVNAVRRALARATRGMSPAPRLILFDKVAKRGLVRCGHLQVDGVKAALSRLGAKGVSFEVIGVSGTIKASKRKFLAS